MASHLLSSAPTLGADGYCCPPPSAARADVTASHPQSVAGQMACPPAQRHAGGASSWIYCGANSAGSSGALRTRGSSRWQVRAASAPGSTLPEQSAEAADATADGMNVADVMTRTLIKVTADTTVDRALEILVENRITGMPVVDDDGKLIGVVSDYDVLALDSISGKREAETGLFPQAGSTWKAFKEIQKLLIKTRGRSVGEVMTPSPLVVRPNTNLESAARLLLESKYRRLPVVDEEGKLVGLLTRGNVVRAALSMKQAMERREV